MTIYPFNILKENIFPILGKDFNELPLYIDLSSNNENVELICNKETQKEFNDYLFKELSKNNKNIAISGYLEYRKSLLAKYPQMIEQDRLYHLGVDVTVKLGTNLYAPLDGEVVESYYEEGEGNYGGLMLLKHNIENCVFYTLYGHLQKDILPKIGTKINKGDIFAKIGDFNENGNWFHHFHLQIITEDGYKNGWVSKGYCTSDDIVNIDKYCPNPIFLLRF